MLGILIDETPVQSACSPPYLDENPIIIISPPDITTKVPCLIDEMMSPTTTPDPKRCEALKTKVQSLMGTNQRVSNN